MVFCAFVWCMFWANRGSEGILHSCQRARDRRESRRQDKRQRKAQQEEDRRERRIEQEAERRARRLHREQVNAEQQSRHAAAQSQSSVNNVPRPAPVALSAVGSSQRFGGSRRSTLGPSAGIPSSYDSNDRAPVATDQGRARIPNWLQNMRPGSLPDSVSQAGHTSQSGRTRLQKRNMSHSQAGWSQPGSSSVSRRSMELPAPAPSSGTQTPRLHNSQSLRSISITSDRSSHHPLLGDAR